MTSTPTSKPEQQIPAVAAPVGQALGWRRWLEPILVATIIVALLTALVSGGVAMFQSVKDDLRSVRNDIVAAETRLDERIDRVSARIDRVGTRIEASEVKLREEIQASEARQNKRIDEVKAEIKDVRTEIKDVRTELKQDNAERKADRMAMNNKLDRVLEALPAVSPKAG